MKPFLRLGPKEFLTGIAPSAHSESGGLFYKADGITPLYDAGGTASAENGILEAGPTPTSFTGIADVPFGAVQTSFTATPFMYLIGAAGHFYQKAVGSGAPTDLRSGTGATTAFTVDLTAATDVVSNVSPTVATLGLANGSSVKYTGINHGGLVQNTIYFVGSISSNTFKLYADQALSSVVDITADTAGASFSFIAGPTTITSPANGITVWGPAGGTVLLYFWMQSKIGTWDMVGTFPSGWNDTAYSITQGNNSTVIKRPHQFVGNVYYPNGDVIGALTDSGTGTVNHSSNVLDFPTHELSTAINDDGQYLVIATTENVTGQPLFANNWIYFWDTFSPSWYARHRIADPFIYSVEKVGAGVVHAFGQYGVWEVTAEFGVKKILSRLIGFGTPADFLNGYGSQRTTTYNTSALMFGTDTTIDTLGKLQPDVPAAYLKNFKIPAGGGRSSLVFSDLDAGRVYVGTTASKLYGFDFNGATHDSGNTAQTVYFDVQDKIQVDRIVLTFAKPLASGDAVQVGIFKDEITPVDDYGSASYAVDQGIRRKSLKGSSVVEEQLSLLLTFTGAARLKRIELYGSVMPSTI